MQILQYRIDNKSGNRLSALGFGCLRFPRTLTIDVGKTEKLIIEAVARGVNYFDTAYVYGGSEAVLGEILHRNGLREQVYIATKLPHGQCSKYEDFDRIFDDELARLKTDYIDYYLIHNIGDRAAWDALVDLGIETWLSEKKASGAVKYFGFSFHGAQAGFFDLLDAYEWDFCQIQYNYMNENYQAGREGLRRAHEKGLSVIIMEPLLGGKLATGLPKDAVRLFSEKYADRTAAEWALRWLYNQPEVTVVLSGMNTLQQLEDNLQTTENAPPGCLSDAETQTIETVKEIIRRVYKVPCTGCNYCMPCPKNVNIPGCFAAYNSRYASGYITGMMQYVTGTSALKRGRAMLASNCVQCGACEKKCPQGIRVANELKTVRRSMEPFWFSAAMRVIRKFFG
ncbi:MAG: aldo/keto reductase [Oscillospiraceae bacterium]|nr:aldo/keto reductase [Oscillospiraceae bacterium]